MKIWHERLFQTLTEVTRNDDKPQLTCNDILREKLDEPVPPQ